MNKARELREMAEEQIRLVWKDAAEALFRLRLQAQTEKLSSPAEVRKHRRTIARCQTILVERGLPVGHSSHAAVAAVAAAEGEQPQHEKHAAKHKASGRAKVHMPGKGGVASRRTFRKRTQSGK